MMGKQTDSVKCRILLHRFARIVLSKHKNGLPVIDQILNQTKKTKIMKLKNVVITGVILCAVGIATAAIAQDKTTDKKSAGSSTTTKTTTKTDNGTTVKTKTKTVKTKESKNGNKDVKDTKTETKTDKKTVTDKK